MNPVTEFAKTCFMLLAALGLGLATYFVTNDTTGDADPELAGLDEPFFSYDPEQATSLEILEYNPQTAETKSLMVQKSGQGLWVLPSHFNYPADAAEQLGQAAAEVRYIKRGPKEADQKVQHTVFGVNDPERLEPGTQGVGRKITVKSGDKEVASIIIGKEDPNQPGIYFVRLEGMDQVYRSGVDVSKFSTKFQDWIDTDLLELNAPDLQEIQFDTYQFDLDAARRGQYPIQDMEVFKLLYDNDAPGDQRWTLQDGRLDDSDLQNPAVKFVNADLGEQTLDVEKLNQMRSALDQLAIINVFRQPDDLAALWTAAPEDVESARQQITISSGQEMISKGFYLAGQGKLVFSQQGQITVGLKTGVEYVLHFGDIAGRSQTAAAEGETTEGEEPKVDRYLIIEARVNEDLIPQPELELVPGELPETMGEKPGAYAELELPAANEAEKAVAEAKRRTIEQQNKIKQQEYDEQLVSAREKADQLNERFANWYYVVSGDVYEKLRFKRQSILKQPGTEGDETGGTTPVDPNGPAAFEELKRSLGE